MAKNQRHKLFTTKVPFNRVSNQNWFLRRPRPRISNAPCLAREGIFVADLIAFASTSLGAAKVRAAVISIPGFADQGQENKSGGLKGPQLLF